MLGDVAHDRAEIIVRQPLTGNLAMQRRNGGRWLGLRHLRRMPVVHTQLRKGIQAQTDFVAADDTRVVHHVEACQHSPAVGAHFHLGQSLKTFGAIDGAVAMQVGDVLAVGIDRDATQGQRKLLLAAAFCQGRRIRISHRQKPTLATWRFEART